MPRVARIVLPGIKHHITQRGNNREKVFFEDADYRQYLKLLVKYSEKYQVQVHGYCLMPNHIHLILTPSHEKSLAKALGQIHYRYTQYVNFMYHRSGHLWQNRFFSCPMDDEHYLKALRYVERNPVRANMVTAASDFQWSSAVVHLGGIDEIGLLDIADWRKDIPADAWREKLSSPEEEADLMKLRINTHTGRPLGSESSFPTYEQQTGKRLIPLPVGRPKKGA
jgi:putative transposase